MKIKTKRYYIYYLLKIASFIIAILPVKVGLYIADLAGKAGFVIMKKERRWTLENLRNAFPEKTNAEVKRIAKEVFSNLCKNAVEWVSVYKLNKKNIDLWVEGGDFKKIDRVFSQGKGGIMLASHFGNWELIHITFLLKGYPGTVIARRLYFDKYDEFLSSVRAYKGLGVIYRDESPKKLLRLLKQNKLIGILADQDVDSVDGVFVDFFGKPAYTPRAPVAFSLASGAPLIPCFMIREGNHHRLVIEEPMYMEEKSSKDETVEFNTQRWSRLIELYIRKYPGQWVWMHRRWKTKPEEITNDKRQNPIGHLKFVIYLLFVIWISGTIAISGCSKKERVLEKQEAQISQESPKIKQEVYTLKVEGFDEERRLQWVLEGESANVVLDKVNIRNLKGIYYEGDTTFTVFADSAIYDKKTQDIELRDNIAGKTTDGGELVTDYAKWNARNEEITTDSCVIIKRQNIKCTGYGLVTKPRLKCFTFQRDVTVDILPDKKILCSGPFEIDHEKNVAIFNNNVKIIEKDSETFADKLTVYLNPDTNKVERVVTEGNVRIEQRGDIGDMGKMSF